MDMYHDNIRVTAYGIDTAADAERIAAELNLTFADNPDVSYAAASDALGTRAPEVWQTYRLLVVDDFDEGTGA